MADYGAPEPEESDEQKRYISESVRVHSLGRLSEPTPVTGAQADVLFEIARNSRAHYAPMHESIGNLVQVCAGVEQLTLRLFSYLLSREAFEEVADEFKKAAIMNLRDRLKRRLPQHWPERKGIARAFDRPWELRNRLVHEDLDFADFEDGQMRTGYFFGPGDEVTIEQVEDVAADVYALRDVLLEAIAMAARSPRGLAAYQQFSLTYHVVKAETEPEKSSDDRDRMARVLGLPSWEKAEVVAGVLQKYIDDVAAAASRDEPT